MGTSPLGGGDALRITEVNASGGELSHAVQTQLSSAVDIRAAHSFFQPMSGEVHLPPIPGFTNANPQAAQLAFKAADATLSTAAGRVGTAALSSAPMAKLGNVGAMSATHLAGHLGEGATMSAVHMAGKLGEGMAMAAANTAGSQTISPLIQMIMRMPGHLGLFSSFFEAIGNFFSGHDLLSALDPSQWLMEHVEGALHAIGNTIGHHLSLDLIPHDLSGLHITEAFGQGHGSLLHAASESGVHLTGDTGVHLSEPGEDLQRMTNASGYADATKAQFEHVNPGSDIRLPPIPGFGQTHSLLSDAGANAFRPTIGGQTPLTPSAAPASGVVNMQPLHITTTPPPAPSGQSSLLSKVHSIDGHNPLDATKHGLSPESAPAAPPIHHPAAPMELKPHVSAHQSSPTQLESHQTPASELNHALKPHQASDLSAHAPKPHHTSELSGQAPKPHQTSELSEPVHAPHLKPQTVARSLLKHSPAVTASLHPQHFASTAHGASQYMVKGGDTLWKIASNHMGSGARWSDIYKANEGLIGSNPSMLHQGMKLNLPEGSGNYVVRSGDNLWSISQTHLGGGGHWPSLYHANETLIGSNPAVLHPGQNLVFPHGSLIHPNQSFTVASHVSPHHLLTQHAAPHSVASSFSESFHPLRAHALLHTPTVHQPVQLATNSVHVGGSEVHVAPAHAAASAAPAQSAPTTQAPSSMSDSVKMTQTVAPTVQMPHQAHSLFWRPEPTLQQHQ